MGDDAGFVKENDTSFTAVAARNWKAAAGTVAIPLRSVSRV
ncbi:hypothetical protein Rleg4DRAFT_2174 [Rhizobium leguminosarum bv. trifolii WSM2297]|uniref:Uncharacterized protein n=1 Tax=Rhizobium leguminosarum bv. trifolii WSM2297 TaxID=754762 RepID=J0W5S6_RHILT|nr:hypothetical protein Rleg4DRAFT_2174 [Rhizobium leguminosarum bv. trifolii WSM2297]